MNGFDGAITVLGVILGSWLAKVSAPEVIVLAGVGACFAMGVSGFFGAYMAEKAERERILERDLRENGKVSEIKYEASQIIPLLLALVDAISPCLSGGIALLPFFLALHEIILIEVAYTLSVVLVLGMLFVLGVYLGKVAKGNGWKYGLAMLAVGLVTALIVLGLCLTLGV